MIKRDKYVKIISYILIAIFAVRLFSYQGAVEGHIGLSSSPLDSKTLTVISLITIWFDYAAMLIIIMRAFFNIKVINTLSKYFVIISSIGKIVFVKNIVTLLTCNYDFSILYVLLILEGLIQLFLSINYILIGIKNKDKFNYKYILLVLGVLGLLLIPTLPSYFIEYMFGFTKKAVMVKKITFEHRLFLYVGIIVPLILYFSLRKKKEEVIRFTLIFISLATMIGFLVNYNYKDFITPWSWPFHLCNTALFILPVCLIFKTKRLFYFTYFINVLGALLAMLMPNYSDGTNILSMRVFNFWYNHWIAFFMPLLVVALKQFDRPKIKQFYYSMVWFFAYFVLALVLNVVFSGLGHNVDYFFINSNYVADKLGTWAENLFNLNASFRLFGIDFVFHPVYQLLFFATYVALGLGVWFIYNEFFIIADNHYELQLKLHAIKLHEIASQNSLSNARKEKLMNSNITASLVLTDVCKKYASSKNYAIEKINLDIHEGEIFGFLGPNGAGKSTIIKSIVGIQQITSGKIEVCGFDNSTRSVEAKYNIGYVPDHYALYEKLTGREYINYIADIYEVPIAERDARIEEHIKLFELENSIDSKIKTYSHGMKQKITIMAALVHNPKVWILDEPLTGLDPNSIYQVKECMIRHAKAGNIVFFSSHIIDIVEKLCGRIAIIKSGHIQCTKTIEEIEKNGINLEKFYLDTIAQNGDIKQ